MKILSQYFIFVILVVILFTSSASAFAKNANNLEKSVDNRDFLRQTPFHQSRSTYSGKHHRLVTSSPTENDILPTSTTTSSSAVSETTETESELINVFFMHRHGARTSAIVRNGVPDWNGCVLSDQGDLMARSLGRFLNERYNGTKSNGYADKSLKYFPHSYDPVKVDSWTTDFERTIRTGASVLQSMFTTEQQTVLGKPAIAPYMQHLPQDIDFMLSYYYSWPSALLHGDDINGWYVRMNPYTENLFSPQELELLGRFLNATQLCKDKPTTCAIVSEDFVTCELSNNPINEIPLLAEVANKTLDRLLHMYHKNLVFNYFSNSSSSYWSGVGFYAAEVVRDMMMKTRIALKKTPEELANDPSTSVIHHYSAHDVTVYGLLVALGVADADTELIELNAPPFTATTLFELYRNGTMRFLYVICNQTYNSDHKFVIQQGPLFRMNCMKQNSTPDQNASELMYKSHSCPFEDIERAMNYTMNTLFPKTSEVLEETMCYADPKDVVETNCDPSSSDPNSNPNCQSYRNFCPTVACSPTWINGERFPDFTPQDLVRESTESNDGKDVLAGHTEMISIYGNTIGTGNFSRNSYEKYVYNSSIMNDGTTSLQCVEIVPFPSSATTWASTLKSPGDKVAVFFSSVLLGIVGGAILAACYVRRKFLKHGGKGRHHHHHHRVDDQYDYHQHDNNNGGTNSLKESKIERGYESTDV